MLGEDFVQGAGRLAAAVLLRQGLGELLEVDLLQVLGEHLGIDLLLLLPGAQAGGQDERQGDEREGAEPGTGLHDQPRGEGRRGGWGTRAPGGGNGPLSEPL